MNLKNMIAVSGHATLMKLVSSRSNGLILKDPATGKTNFFSTRSHQFTPLETVGIYTMTDTVEIKEVFQKMMEKASEVPPISPKSTNPELLNYFAQVLPDYDRDKVYPGVVKKVIKWYNNLHELGLLQASSEEE